MDSKSSCSNPPVTKDAQPRASSVVKTPCPYEQGKSVDLSVTKTFSNEIKVGQLSATVTKVYTMTMSPVTEIVYKTKSGGTKKGVLKVYDRRFGHSFRDIPGLPGKGYFVHTPAAESSWHRYVRDGKANALFEETKASYEQTATFPRRPAQY